MFRKNIAVASCLVALPLALFTVSPAEAGTGHAAVSATSATPTDCGPGSLPDFKAGNFPQEPRVDNTWLPMKPGTRSEFSGTVKDLTTSPPEVHTHRVVSIVTGLTKEIDGVRTVVLWDRDYSDGVLEESELAFFAQTRKGAVWLLGEYPEEFDAGKFTGAPNTFITGVDKARAGVAMLAHPSEGSGPYTQASAPSIDFLDCGQVVSRTATVLKVDEFNPLEGSAAGHQQKYYRAGVGSFKVTASSGDSQEFLKLDATTTLDADALAAVDRHALAQDRHGYTVSPDVYGTTERARAGC
ncbi:hypothetical protein [Arthrobacter sp. NicSoilB8]|uniref:hypothetical protein n=1 Tax=Arthrobacter sp. NicSoilB8 TaxID=2830998 RepID=UPI001CC8146D|nr:hypothetical protein [Arthrobacter sp. NicSoilB8]BCW71564.1 hypothetical protein NicSoilB8_26080 [Arthrobacter sp. NicSoilB8]